MTPGAMLSRQFAPVGFLEVLLSEGSDEERFIIDPDDKDPQQPAWRLTKAPP